MSVYTEPFFRVTNKITVTIFTVSGGSGALGLGESLKNRVRPLVEGGELKCLEGADGQTGGRKQRGKRMEKTEQGKRRESLLVEDGEQSQVKGESWMAWDYIKRRTGGWMKTANGKVRVFMINIKLSSFLHTTSKI